MSNIVEMIDTIDEKLKALPAPYLLDTDNVIGGETYIKTWKPNSEFPRIEYTYEGEDNFTYYSQKSIIPVNVFMITAFYRTIDFDQSVDRLKFIAEAGRVLMSAMFSMNTDKRMGTSLISGFLHIHEIFHIDAYQEVESRLDSVKVKFGIDSSRNWALT